MRLIVASEQFLTRLKICQHTTGICVPGNETDLLQLIEMEIQGWMLSTTAHLVVRVHGYYSQHILL